MLLALVLLLGLPTAWVMARDTDEVADTGVVAVKRGEFLVTVTTSGELRAPKSVQITAPTNAQQAGVFQMKIQSLIPEGTVVKAGDVVAELDRSTLANQMQEVSLAMQKAQALFQQAMLDTTLTLSQAREDLRNMELALEEKNIAKEPSISAKLTHGRCADQRGGAAMSVRRASARVRSSRGRRCCS